MIVWKKGSALVNFPYPMNRGASLQKRELLREKEYWNYNKSSLEILLQREFSARKEYRKSPEISLPYTTVREFFEGNKCRNSTEISPAYNAIRESFLREFLFLLKSEEKQQKISVLLEHREGTKLER